MALINDLPTDLETDIERRFLRRLEGGCTAPIGAKATLEGEQLSFVGNLFSLDGKSVSEVKKTIPITAIEDFPEACADEVLYNGGREMMEEIRKVMNIQK